MDSRQLCNAAAHLGSVMTYSREWVHFGTGRDIKLSLIEKLIDDFLADEELHVVHGRRTSFTTTRSDTLKKIQGLLGEQSFEVWNSAMDKVIKFNRIGVLLTGSR